ncbi:hypothetical protein EYV94_00680 [Puteibacter caeruleilacunae]|nr:hypothetical protein EYV94_00680 [Puteibacter caeruleilacunae]
MTRRIRIILFLVVISIIGLISLQVHWIGKFYKNNREQLLKELNLAMENSVKTELTNRYQEDMQTLLKGGSAKVVTISSSANGANLDSLLKSINTNNPMGGHAEFSMKFESMDEATASLDSIPEKIELRIREMVTALLQKESAETPAINMTMIDTLFRSELKSRNLQLDYFMHVTSSENDSVLINPNNIAVADTTDFLHTRAFATSITGDRMIRAYIQNENQVIFTQMGVSLSITVILFILIMTCFFYMLSTIFRQKQLSQIKNDFINNMTHELKTPIATVSAVVESMQSFGALEDKEKSERYLNVSQRELGRLSDLVEKVLNMAREEREPMRMNPEEINFNELCNNIIHSKKFSHFDKEVDIKLNISPDACRFRADRFHMVNVVQNLIENSIKYSGEQLKINISCDKQNHEVALKFTDNGIGIAKKHQEKIFEKFYRVSTGDIHNVKGFGLGLHYVKNIIEKHNGKITVSSEPTKGTTFTIIIPC